MSATKLNRENELETILTLCVMLVVVYFVTKQLHTWLLSLSVLLGLIGMFFKYLSSKIAWAWMKLAEGMGFVSSKIILSIVFFLILCPVALLSRVFGKSDHLQLKKPEGSSYYYPREHKYGAADLENMW